MKYVFSLICILLLVIMDLACRFLDLIIYPFVVLWHFEFVEFNFVDYRCYDYPKGGSFITHNPIGYYPNIYDCILDRNYVEIE